jgi:hypothetical protein
LHELAQERAALRTAQNIIAEEEAALAATSEGKLLAEHRAILAGIKTHCDVVDAKVRDLALASYAATGSKQPAKGVTIRVGKRLVYDRIKASAWARTNAPALFTLDIKAWEKAAPTLPDAPIEIVEEPSVAIASDLAGI